MINQLMNPKVKELDPLGCHFMEGSLTNYKNVMGDIFDLIERASFRVPRVDEPWLWVFLN